MSLFTTISGITNNQAMLDVIGDNIANINTTAFKSSKINFETIFSNTISAGSAPSAISGGVNPKQFGLGVTVSEISRNFTRGAVQSTGRSSDLNIQGEGFFTFRDTDGKMVLSRAGNFSVDADGNLVNARGLKALGTSSVASDISGTATIKIPTSLVLVESNLITSGAASISPGTFVVSVGGVAQPSISIEDTDTILDVVNKINSTLRQAPSSTTATLNASNQIVFSGPDTIAVADGTSNFATNAGLTAAYKSGTVSGTPDAGTFTITVNGTAHLITIGATDTYSNVVDAINGFLENSTATLNTSNQIIISGTDTLTFGAPATSTFPADANFVQGGGPYTTDSFTDTPQVDITAGAAGLQNNYKANSYSISSDGAIEVTYANGARLTVTTLTGETSRSLKYVTSGGKTITGVTTAAVDPAQLQIQLANVINPKGLSSIGGNLFSMGSVAGEPNFAIGSTSGMGSIDSGALEASNVDLPTEFANMILAQKAVEANSRAFSVQNQIMDVIVNLGR